MQKMIKTKRGFVTSADNMTLQDYFAAQALQGMIGTAAAPCLLGFDKAENHIAKAAYLMADAMLKAREE